MDEAGGRIDYRARPCPGIAAADNVDFGDLPGDDCDFDLDNHDFDHDRDVGRNVLAVIDRQAELRHRHSSRASANIKAAAARSFHGRPMVARDAGRRRLSQDVPIGALPPMSGPDGVLARRPARCGSRPRVGQAMNNMAHVPSLALVSTAYRLAKRLFLLRKVPKATWRSGYAAVCKTVYSGSIPDVASTCVSLAALESGSPTLRAGVMSSQSTPKPLLPLARSRAPMAHSRPSQRGADSGRRTRTQTPDKVRPRRGGSAGPARQRAGGGEPGARRPGILRHIFGP